MVRSSSFKLRKDMKKNKKKAKKSLGAALSKRGGMRPHPKYEAAKAYLAANPGSKIKEACAKAGVSLPYFYLRRKREETVSSPTGNSTTSTQIQQFGFSATLPNGQQKVVVMLMDPSVATELLRNLFR